MTAPAPDITIQKLHDTEEIQTSFLYVLFISSVAALGGFSLVLTPVLLMAQ